MLSGVLTEEDEEAVLNELDQIIEETLPAAPQKEQLGDKEEELALPEVPDSEGSLNFCYYYILVLNFLFILVAVKEKEKAKQKEKERIAVEAS